MSAYGLSRPVAIYEVVQVTEAIAERIGQGVSRAELGRVLAEEGFIGIDQLGLRRVLDGETTVEEIRRLLGTTLGVAESSA